MIKEIQKIAEEMIVLNNQVFGAILSHEDLKLLQTNLAIILQIQKKINHSLSESSLICTTNKKQIIQTLYNINQLISELAIAIDQIQELSGKFVCNYRNNWNIIRKNTA